jgi:hypothetical protein
MLNLIWKYGTNIVKGRIMIRNVNKFLSEFEKIVSKYIWYLDTVVYSESDLVLDKIRGVTEESGDIQIYDPLTAYTKETCGESIPLERFDKVSSVLFLSSDITTTLVDAIDDWPQQLNGYKPKRVEKEIRQRLLDVCGL